MIPYQKRHIALSKEDENHMLQTIGYSSMEAFLEAALPNAIKDSPLEEDEKELFWEAQEEGALNESVRLLLDERILCKSLIGQGFKNTETPPLLSRMILENPAFYTAYTPYQAEISQGRMHLLYQFQTMSTEITGLHVASSSLLDEASSAVEAMSLCIRANKTNNKKQFFADSGLNDSTLATLQTRAKAWNLDLDIAPLEAMPSKPYSGAISTPFRKEGKAQDMRAFASFCQEQKILSVCSLDPLVALCFDSVGSQGIDVALGSFQRFGLPLFFGGPHAAFMAVRKELMRQMPGRIVGKSIDRLGNEAYRLSLQTREQHIRREKANSNICTSQSLTAILSTAYCAYYGKNSLRAMALQSAQSAHRLAQGLLEAGFSLESESFFDTISLKLSKEKAFSLSQKVLKEAKLNLYPREEGRLIISLDETIKEKELKLLAKALHIHLPKDAPFSFEPKNRPILEQPFFQKYQSEVSMTRELSRIADLDYALNKGMIPLGSCTMKLNSVSSLLVMSNPFFQKAHPLTPKEQVLPLLSLLEQSRLYLERVTGFYHINLQPNSGAQGEYAGLLAIKSFHESKGEPKRIHCLIPKSAHGTNPASAVCAGFIPIIVETTQEGTIDPLDLKNKAEIYQKSLAALMLTYPSTSGVFDKDILSIIQTVQTFGAKVYMDGANFNAWAGFKDCSKLGVDVMHFNLHKTFSVPHGGGGPGVGPIGLSKELAPFSPKHPHTHQNPQNTISSSAFAAPPAILISYFYLRLLGLTGLKKSTSVALLNANYLAQSLRPFYPILFQSEKGTVAHECILDLRFLKELGLKAEDLAKRLSDYGFHAPTLSFPVQESMMIEPTESEPKEELDRFIESMRLIKDEILATKQYPATQNPLVQAPHSLERLFSKWTLPYSKEVAFFPRAGQKRQNKYFPCERIDDVYGDRNPKLTDSESYD